MYNDAKKFFIVGLVTVAAGLTVNVEAGTSRSLGGHGMVNARNSIGSRSLGGHNLGGSIHSANMSTINQRGHEGLTNAANYVRAHGGTVTASKGNGHASLSVTTGRGGSLEGTATITGVTMSNNSKSYTIRADSEATTASGGEYVGFSNAVAGVTLSDGTPTSAYFSNYKGIVGTTQNGDFLMSHTDADGEMTKEGTGSYQRQTLSMVNGMTYDGSTTVSNSTGSPIANHQGQVTNSDDEVVADLTTSVAPVDNQTIKIEHSTNDYAYTMYVTPPFKSLA